MQLTQDYRDKKVSPLTLNIVNAEVHSLFDQFTDLVQGSSQFSEWQEHISVPPAVGQGSIRRTRIRSGMEIVVTDITFAQDMKLHIQEACQLFELSYCLNGEIYCEWNGRESFTEKMTGNVLFFEDELVYEEKKAGIRQHMLEIRLSPKSCFIMLETSPRNTGWNHGCIGIKGKSTNIRTRLLSINAYRI